MKPTVIYLRTSTEEQNPKLQLKDCIELAKKLGLNDYEVLEEYGSAFKDNVKRPVLDSIQKAIWKDKTVKNIIIWDFDRLFRNRIKTIEFIRNYGKIGLKVYSCRQDWFQAIEKMPIPFNEMMKDLMLQMIGWIAEEESQKKSDRIKNAVRKNKKGITVSYKGNRWGKKLLSKVARQKILELHKEGYTMRMIAKNVTYADKNNNMKNVSLGIVHKTITENTLKNNE